MIVQPPPHFHYFLLEFSYIYKSFLLHCSRIILTSSHVLRRVKRYTRVLCVRLCECLSYSFFLICMILSQCFRLINAILFQQNLLHTNNTNSLENSVIQGWQRCCYPKSTFVSDQTARHTHVPLLFSQCCV